MLIANVGVQGSPEDAADFTRQVLLGAEASADAQGAFKKGLTACVQWACDGASEACDAFVQDIISGKLTIAYVSQNRCLYQSQQQVQALDWCLLHCSQGLSTTGRARKHSAARITLGTNSRPCKNFAIMARPSERAIALRNYCCRRWAKAMPALVHTVQALMKVIISIALLFPCVIGMQDAVFYPCVTSSGIQNNA